MRSDRDESIRRHPSSGVAVVERAVASETRPYKQFMDALEELSMVVSLHGTASTEANLARARVRGLREQAAEAWRAKDQAA